MRVTAARQHNNTRHTLEIEPRLEPSREAPPRRGYAVSYLPQHQFAYIMHANPSAGKICD
eukprot:2045819-Lingulodinium_polyedra.AAC.1